MNQKNSGRFMAQKKLSKAICAGRLKEIEEITRDWSRLIADAPIAGRQENPMVSALKKGHMEVITYAVDHLAWSFQLDNVGRAFPHHLAEHDKHVDLFRRLAEKNAKALDVFSGNGMHSLDIAARKRQWKMCDFLLSNMNKETIARSKGLVFLAFTYSDGDIDFIRRILETGASPSEGDDLANIVGIAVTLLKKYAQRDSEKLDAMFGLLFRAFPDKLTRAYPCSKVCPLAGIKAISVTAVLLEYDQLKWICTLIDDYHLNLMETPTVVTHHGRMTHLLNRAAARGKSEIFSLLMQEYAIPADCDWAQGHPLFYALKGGHLEIVRILFEEYGIQRTEAEFRGDIAAALLLPLDAYPCADYLWGIIPDAVKSGCGPFESLKAARYVLETLKAELPPTYYRVQMSHSARRGHRDIVSYLLREHGSHYEALTKGPSAFQKVYNDLYGLGDEDREVCVVCYREPTCVLTYPCNHVCMCAECGAREERCPFLTCQRECGKRLKLVPDEKKTK